MIEFLLDPDVFLSFKPAEAACNVWMLQTLHNFCLLNEESFTFFLKFFFNIRDFAAFKSDILFDCLIVRLPDFALATSAELIDPNILL